MKCLIPTTAALLAVATITLDAPHPTAAHDVKATSETTVSGVKFPESVGYDPDEGVLYVSQFVSELAPTKKDGQGRITKMSVDGEVLEEGFLPAEGQVLDKPKGIWIADGSLWVTDIDTVWQFDLETKEGREVSLPGAEFANDVTIADDALYVSDNRGDRMFRVTPADFLGMDGDPEVETIYEGGSVNPNGVYPAEDGGVLTVGFKSKDEPRAIFRIGEDRKPAAISDPIGQLDGVYRRADGSLIFTNWVTGSLLSWNESTGQSTLAEGFSGPADLAAFESDGGLTVVVPDLVKSELRIVKLGQ